MKLSIIINNYNYEQFVGEAIDSALSQRGDVEVIVVDDGSTDGSRNVIEGYKDQIVAIFKENGGQNSAVNAGFERVTGGAVIILDADDRLDADTGAEVIAAFTNGDLARVQWPLRMVDTQGVPTGKLSPNPRSMASGNLKADVMRYRTHVWPPQSGNAYATVVLRQVFPIPDYFRIGCDKYLADTTVLLGPIKSLASPGGDYRIHGSNNYSRGGLDVEAIRKQIVWTLETDKEMRKVEPEFPDSMTLLDVAFICQRLASCRLEPAAHPIETDRRRRLIVSGIRAAIAHPHHSARHKAKRIVWIIGVGLGPISGARALVKKFYFRHKA